MRAARLTLQTALNQLPITEGKEIQQEEAVSVGEETLSDEELVAQVQGGQTEAYEGLVRRYQRRIYALIYHMVGNREDADDLVQETFIRAYRSIRRFRGKSRFFTWLYRIALNETYNFLKKRANRQILSLEEFDAGIETEPSVRELIQTLTPHREVHLAEIRQRLNEAMQKLSPIHRTVVTLHDIQGLSHEEISRIMRCRVGTVRSRLFYARQQLQAYLSDLIS